MPNRVATTHLTRETGRLNPIVCVPTGVDGVPRPIFRLLRRCREIRIEILQLTSEHMLELTSVRRRRRRPTPLSESTESLRPIIAVACRERAGA